MQTLLAQNETGRGARQTPAGKRRHAQPHLSAETNRPLENAEREADALKDQFISTEHLLMGLLALKNGAATRILKESGVSRDTLLKALAGLARQ